MEGVLCQTAIKLAIIALFRFMLTRFLGSPSHQPSGDSQEVTRTTELPTLQRESEKHRPYPCKKQWLRSLTTRETSLRHSKNLAPAQRTATKAGIVHAERRHSQKLAYYMCGKMQPIVPVYNSHFLARFEAVKNEIILQGHILQISSVVKSM